LLLVLLDIAPLPGPGIGRLFDSPVGLLALGIGLVAVVAALWLRRR
jgi:hypothetical protein